MDILHMVAKASKCGKMFKMYTNTSWLFVTMYLISSHLWTYSM